MKKLTPVTGPVTGDVAVDAAAVDAAPVAAVPTPAAAEDGQPAVPPPAEAFGAEHPHEGGSYIRQPDGSLTRASDEEEPA